MACFEPTEAARFLKKLEVHSVLYGQGKNVFKREFLYLSSFLHFNIDVKKKNSKCAFKKVRVKDRMSLQNDIIMRNLIYGKFRKEII